MEELLTVVIQIVLEILVSLPFDATLSALERRRTHAGGPFERPLVGVIAGGAVVGLLLGAFSLGVRGNTLLPWPLLRIANLVGAPLLAGLLARTAANWRTRRGRPSSPKRHFWFAFALTLALVSVRFGYAIRAA